MKIFAGYDLQGQINLGRANTEKESIIVWFHNEGNQYTFLPAFKKNTDDYQSQIKDFIPIEKDDAFAYEGILYYHSQEGELLRVDMLFDMYLAISFLSLKLDLAFSEAELCYVFLDDEETYSDICWAAYPKDGIPRVCSVFMDGSSPLAKCQEQFIHYIPMQIGQLFSHNGIMWMLHSGKYGQEIRPFRTINNTVS